ncbi:hypothetical protein ACFCWY_09670 [Streptomyces sp. NPDC056362]|uniref:hypothetical protein n=1 Tax=unclassified Streptomyces TaxID=2593676 RepID=UPI0035DA540A
MTQNGQGPEQGGGQPWGGAWGPAGGPPGGQPLPPAQPLPPEAPQAAADMQSTQYLPPIPPQQGAPQPGYGYPGPGAPAAGDMQATQHIPPVSGGMPPAQGMPPQQGGMPPAQGAPQAGYGYPGPGAPQPGYGYPGPGAQGAPQPGYGYPHPGAPSAGDLQATQHIPPVPPQQGGGSDTQFLGTGPLAHQGPGPAGASDATQYIAPVPPQEPGERQPPAEFDSLFRTEAPRPPQQQRAPQGYQQPGPAPYQQHQQQQPPQPPQQQFGFQDAYYEDEEPAPRRKSPVALIAAVVVGCAVVGLGAGALLSGGDEEKDPKTGGQNVAASSAAPSAPAEKPAEKPADPAEPQAKELSKLLATSSSSRETVISSVAAINQCKDLDQAASDLRGAAEQRRGLIAKLQALSVDKVPDNAALTASLTKAWQASASADDHYAAWADQMKAKKACKGGKAHSTSQRTAGDAKSGEATQAKKSAAGLWNPTAAKYGLEKRSWTQL